MSPGEIYTPRNYIKSTCPRRFLAYHHDLMPHGPIRTNIEYQVIYQDGTSGLPTKDVLKSWNAWIFKHDALCEPVQVEAVAEVAAEPAVEPTPLPVRVPPVLPATVLDFPLTDLARAQEREEAVTRTLSMVFIRAFTEALEVMEACGSVNLPGVQEWRQRNLNTIREHVKELDAANAVLGKHKTLARA